MAARLRVGSDPEALSENALYWDELAKIKRRRYILQERFRQPEKHLRTISPTPELNLEPISGIHGRLVQLIFSILLQPRLSLPLEADTLREQLQVLEPQYASLMTDIGLARLEDLLCWIEQRYPTLLTMEVARCDNAYRPMLITAMKTHLISVLYLEVFQEVPSILIEPRTPVLPHEAEELLAIKSVEEQKALCYESEVLALLTKPSAGDLKAMDALKSKDGPAVREFCQYNIRDNCPEGKACSKLHFVVLINAHTDRTSGDCPYALFFL